MLTHLECTSLISQIAYPNDNAQLIDMYHKVCSGALAKQSFSCFYSLGMPGTALNPGVNAWLVTYGMSSTVVPTQNDR